MKVDRDGASFSFGIGSIEPEENIVPLAVRKRGLGVDVKPRPVVFLCLADNRFGILREIADYIRDHKASLIPVRAENALDSSVDENKRAIYVRQLGIRIAMRTTPYSQIEFPVWIFG